jgi:hypothetical protein
MTKFTKPVKIPSVDTSLVETEEGFASLYARSDGRVFAKTNTGEDQDLTNESRISALENRKTIISSSNSTNRALDTSFVIDTERDSYVNYTVRTVATIAASVAPISAALQISPDGVNFSTVATSENASLISLGGLLSISLLQDSSTPLTAMVPAGFTVRIQTTGQVPPANTITLTNAHETIFDISIA